MSSSSNPAGGSAVAVSAWLICSIYYFGQYVMRSAPAVMVPQLSDAFGLSVFGVTALVGLFYYGYAPFSLAAGVAIDQFGPRRVVPVGAAAMGAGALMFASGDPVLAGVGRFLQGAGGVFALVGAAYIASRYFPAARAATLIGATQMFGMAGGSAGQFAVGPAIAGGMSWQVFWVVAAFTSLVLAALLFVFIPKSKPALQAARGVAGLRTALGALASVFGNPQSLLCGLISGLMFLPTTIFDMVWGVRFLQEAYDAPYSEAVLRSASVPFGWILGCPALGWLSDRIGLRRPVIAGGGAVLAGSLAFILFGPADLLPPFLLGGIMGFASGAAMLPYTVIKEANRPDCSGAAIGVVNFLNFSLSALAGPFIANAMAEASGGAERGLIHYQATFAPLLWGCALAVMLTLLLQETGTRRRAGRLRGLKPSGL